MPRRGIVPPSSIPTSRPGWQSVTAMIRPILTELTLFVTPFVLYALYVWATHEGVLDVSAWSVPRLIWLSICGLRPRHHQLRAAGAVRRRAARLDLYPGPHGKRAPGARHGAMTAPVTMRLAEDGWLRAPAVQRVLDLLNGDGEEARVVGGAARNALHRRGAERHRHRDHRLARRGDAACRRRRHQGGADRHRARHRHAGRRRGSVRGDDAARGRRDLRP